MFLRKYWLPLSVFIVVICAVGLYYLQTRPPKEPIVIYKPVEPLPKPTEQPTAEVPVGDTSQGGHWHGDEWHADPHETLEQPSIADISEPTAPVRTQNASQVQQDSQQRMLPEDILSPEYIAMVKKAVQTAIATRGLETEEGNALWVDARNLITEARGDAGKFRQIYYDTGDRSYLDKCYQIEALDDPYMDFVAARFPKPKMNSEQLSQLRKAADEFDALLPKNPIGGEPLPNPYRERLQEEENR